MRALVAGILKCGPHDLGPDSGLGATANWDSFAQLEIMMVLDERYSVEISDASIRRFSAFHAIEEYVAEKAKR